MMTAGVLQLSASPVIGGHPQCGVPARHCANLLTIDGLYSVQSSLSFIINLLGLRVRYCEVTGDSQIRLGASVPHAEVFGIEDANCLRYTTLCSGPTFNVLKL